MIKDLFTLICRDRISTNRGFGLLETIIGATILTVGILSILSVSTRLISVQDFVKNREGAIFLSQDGFEAIKNRLEDNFNRCNIDNNLLVNVWNCWGAVAATTNSCDCADLFSDTESYRVDFNGSGWSISVVALNSWQPLFYNCPMSESFCFYSHAASESYSTPTIYERKISVENRADYDSNSYDDMIRISSVVRWEERGDLKYVTTTSEFYNWRWRKK